MNQSGLFSNDPYLVYGKAKAKEEPLGNSGNSSNSLVVFKYSSKSVRTIQINGETWFVLKDVCDVLDIGNVTDTANRLDDDERGIFDLIEHGRIYQKPIVNESGLYSVILRSDKPDAKAFKRWVTHEVLPQIRKTGSYIAAPKTYIEALEALLASEKEKELLQIESAQKQALIDRQKTLLNRAFNSFIPNGQWKKVNYEVNQRVNRWFRLPSDYKCENYTSGQVLMRNAIGFCCLQDSCNVDFKKTDVDISIYREYMEEGE